MTNEYINPLIMPEMPEAYRQYHERTAESAKEAQELQRLCYELLASDNGKKLIEMYTEQHIMQSKINPNVKDVKDYLLYWEGFRDCIRSFKENALAHHRHINKCNNQV